MPLRPRREKEQKMTNVIEPLTRDQVDRMKNVELARFIDHTMLKADAPRAAFDKLCDEAKQYGFFSVCVNSCRVAYVEKNLRGSGIFVCSVVGFPLGAMETGSKAFEAERAVGDGADEIDMVMNIGALKDREWDKVEDDIRAVKEATGSDRILKVIIETCLLTDEEKIKACQLAAKAGADFVKTSTGFSTGGATLSDVALMRKTVGPHIGVKAAGGVFTTEDAKAMLKAGATRIGTVKGIQIVSG